VRAEIAQAVVAAASESALLQLIASFPDNDDAAALIRALGAVMLPRPMSEERARALRTRLAGGGMDYEWPQILASSPSTAARNFRDVLATVVQLPDYQLC
jgi:hypothetical protein